MDSLIQLLFWVAFSILLCVLLYEVFPYKLSEGFEGLVGVGDSKFWAKLVPRRGDIGPEQEEDGFIPDRRYFSGYVDVQRFGVKTDFCRFVQQGSDEKNKFLACGLGGTDKLSSTAFRSPSVRDGFILGRDDYMRDIDGDGRDDYCRIVKQADGTFRSECNSATETGFSAKLVPDSNPPSEIKTLLQFYQGCVFWLRLRDDMLDYAKNLTIAKAGGMEIQEAPPNPPITEGLEFNGNDQFLRIGDAKDLSFGEVVQLRYLRATCFWVYFDEFTNNAHIYDFGNGAGKDNVFVGIMGRGNAGPQSDELLKPVCLDQAITTVPAPPSGQQCVEEMSPERSMITSSANVNLWQCPKPELFGKIMKPLEPKAAPAGEAKTADLIYEIWEGQMRKLHIQVKNVIPLRKWVHIAITAGDNDAWKPNLKIYRNGSIVHTEGAAWLPQTNYTTNNYIGKSNWQNMTSPYENADKLFKGKMFDFRGYRIAMDEKKVKDTYKWGKNLLGLEQDEA